jgi:predicted dehydrogenase
LRRLGVGIIGCGRISGHHARGYLSCKEDEIVATCDLSEEKAKQKAHELGAKRVYTDYHRLLKDDEVDIVGIYTFHSNHAQITIDAAEAGKHISCQKPIAMRRKDADEVVRVVRKAGIKYQYMELDAWTEPIVKVRNLIKAGEIGEPRLINVTNRPGPYIEYLDKFLGRTPNMEYTPLYGVMSSPEEYEKREERMMKRLPDELRNALIEENKWFPGPKERMEMRQSGRGTLARKEMERRERLREVHPSFFDAGDLDEYGISWRCLDVTVHWVGAVVSIMGGFERVGSMMEFIQTKSPRDPSKTMFMNRAPVIMWKHKTGNRYGTQIGEGSEDGYKVYTVYGIKGTLRINHNNGGPKAITLWEEDPETDDYRRAIDFDLSEGYWWPAARLAARDHIDAILQDRDPKLTVEDGREVLFFLYAMGKSAKEGKIVEI